MTTTVWAGGKRLGLHERGRLVLEVISAHHHVRREMSHHTLPVALARLRSPRYRRRVLPLADGRFHGRRLGAIVTRTLDLLPVRSTCLTRSLVLLRLLAARGIAGDLVIAALPSDSKPLDAHAWVELDGRALLRAEPTFGRLITL